jgi:hypothetical protein
VAGAVLLRTVSGAGRKFLEDMRIGGNPHDRRGVVSSTVDVVAWNSPPASSKRSVPPQGSAGGAPQARRAVAGPTLGLPEHGRHAPMSPQRRARGTGGRPRCSRAGEGGRKQGAPARSQEGQQPGKGDTLGGVFLGEVEPAELDQPPCQHAPLFEAPPGRGPIAACCSTAFRLPASSARSRVHRWASSSLSTQLSICSIPT